MKLGIISWNVRGVNDAKKIRMVKICLKTYRMDLVCFQETKMKEMTGGAVRSLVVGRFVN